LKANHFHDINFLALLKFGKHKTTNKTPSVIFLCLSYGCLCATYLVRTGGSGTQSPSRSLARSTLVLCLYWSVVGS